MSDKVKIRVLSPFMLSATEAATVGEILDIDPLVAYSLDRSKAELIDPAKAEVLINEAAKAHNNTLPRAPRGSLLPGAPATPAWSVLLPREPGYLPYVH